MCFGMALTKAVPYIERVEGMEIDKEKVWLVHFTSGSRQRWLATRGSR